jgi:Flp pilus assembly protein TadG
MNRVRQTFGRNDSGAVAVYVAIALVVLIGAAALAMDIAHMVSVKRELTKAAEAGALSGARGFWPQNLSTATSRDPDCTTATNVATTTATKNRVEGINLTTDEVTVEVGRWDYAAKVFTPGSSVTANGVRVTTSRANVQTILAQVLGQGPRNMGASAVAIMDFVCEVGKGCLPIAVNRDYIDPEKPPFFINFTPDTYDNAGWFSDPPDPASASTIKDYINNAACPPLYKGQLINLNNGNDTTCLQDLQAKLDANGGNWVVCLPVVDVDKFNQDTPITDFVSFKITQVIDTGNPKGVWGKVLCIYEFQNALPGGGKAGALAPPKLVQ